MKRHNPRNVVAFPFIIVLLTCSIVLTTAFPKTARAELVDNGGGLVYDTDLDVTWYVPTVDPMTWSEAVSWAAGLSVSNDNASNITGWRLPSVLNEDGTGPCGSYNCMGSEFGHLYYRELGNTPGRPIANKGPFSNLNTGVYWSALGWERYPGNAWAFNFSTGVQGFADKNLYANFYPMAVHDGNVGGGPVRSSGTATQANVKEATAHAEHLTLRVTQESR